MEGSMRPTKKIAKGRELKSIGRSFSRKYSVPVPLEKRTDVAVYSAFILD